MKCSLLMEFDSMDEMKAYLSGQDSQKVSGFPGTGTVSGYDMVSEKSSGLPGSVAASDSQPNTEDPILDPIESNGNGPGFPAGFISRKLLSIFAFIAFFSLAVLAFGQDTTNTAGATLSDFLVRVVFPVLSAFLIGLLGAVLNKLRQKFNLQIDASQQAKLEQLVIQGIAYVEEKAAARVKTNITKYTGKEKLDMVLKYVMTAAPAITKDQADALVHSLLARVSGAGATGDKAIQ